MKKLLIIAQHWPEPATNAAGIRIMQLIEFFQMHLYEVHVACAVPRNEYSLNLDGVTTKEILLNDSSFDDYVSQLQPYMVLYDRYNVEEQYGWRLRENCPETIQLLDTEDLHFLRKAREKALKLNMEVSHFYNDDIALREIASIYRCDLSLIISEVELELLNSYFKIPQEILWYLPFLIDEKEMFNKPFNERNGFITVGNLKHPPNKDALLFLKNELWPLIREKSPHAILNIYGAYADQQVRELHSERTGFLVKGFVEDINTKLSSARVMLAPLRYGAGLKGKLVTAMQCHTPAVMTSIASEGMYGALAVPGVIEDEIHKFATAAVKLSSDKTFWQEKSNNTGSIIKHRFNKKILHQNLSDRLEKLGHNLKEHRHINFMGKLLQHHSLRSTKYLSKWIEEKNRRKKNRAF